MTSQKIAFGLVAVALFVGSMTAHAVDISEGYKAYQRGDYATALRVFRQLADQGNYNSQVGLGFMYFKGQGVAQDYEEAVRWYRKAADQGWANAQSNLGFMYFKGFGVKRNYEEAVRWYRKAADQGWANAQNNLGGMYLNGQGVTQDYVQAHMWFDLAATGGRKDAENSREKTAEQMTPVQIAEARRLAREWKPKGK